MGQNTLCIGNFAELAKSTLVFYDLKAISEKTLETPRYGKFADLTLELKYSTPQFKELKSPFLHALWHKYHILGHQKKTTELIVKGFWEKSSEQTYSLRMKLWYLYCKPHQINPLFPEPKFVVEHIAKQTQRDASATHTCLKWLLPDKYSDILYTMEINRLCKPRIYAPL